MTANDIARLCAPVEALVGRKVVAWAPVPTGYTQAARWIASFDDGSSAFVKAGTDDSTDQWLKAELDVYRSVHADFLPALLGSSSTEDGRSLLLLEDLSGGLWPPPWSPSLVERVLSTLSRVASTPVPAGIPSIEDQRPHVSGWPMVERDPAPFLSLGVCSSQWLGRALPVLLRAEREAVFEGEAFLHFDVRSDNICFSGDRTLLVDWNWASFGNPSLDIVTWLPSLRSEGGPSPDELYSGEPELIAWFAGYLAGRAGLPPPQGLEGVRTVQSRQLTVALPWAARALGLPQPA